MTMPTGWASWLATGRFCRNNCTARLDFPLTGNWCRIKVSLGSNLQRYRLAFEAMRVLNLEFLSLCCARVSQKMLRTPEELKENAAVLESNVQVLSGLLTKSAA